MLNKNHLQSCCMTSRITAFGVSKRNSEIGNQIQNDVSKSMWNLMAPRPPYRRILLCWNCYGGLQLALCWTKIICNPVVWLHESLHSVFQSEILKLVTTFKAMFQRACGIWWHLDRHTEEVSLCRNCYAWWSLALCCTKIICNPVIWLHESLHSVFRRVEWIGSHGSDIS